MSCMIKKHADSHKKILFQYELREEVCQGINRIKYFRIGFDFTEIFDHKVRKIRLPVVHDTAELKF